MFVFKLAREMRCTPRELLARMNAKELAYQMAFATLEPLPEDRADLRAAMIAHTMACMWSGDKGTRPKFENFMIVKPRRPKQTPAEMMAMADMATSALSVLPKE